MPTAKVRKPATAAGERAPRRSFIAKQVTNRGEPTFDQPGCLSVYSGRLCIGHLVLRGKSGVEAFDADDRSLGIFPNQQLAVAAVATGAA
jgi:hypothetical protein